MTMTLAVSAPVGFLLWGDGQQPGKEGRGGWSAGGVGGPRGVGGAVLTVTRSL